MANDWTREEVEATVSDYFDMLMMEYRGESFNKAEHNRRLQKLLNSRSKGAIEKKHQNISAVIRDLGFHYVDGYKPLENYQKLLYSIVRERARGAQDLHRVAAAAVEQEIENPPIVKDVLAILVNPPSRKEERPKLYDRDLQIRPRPGRNYLEMESRNRTLGLAGERLVLEFERKRLWQAGKKDLADRVEHLPDTAGDHLGFDIRSFETDGRDRLIEVKTTRFGASTPFFASRNEVEVSDVREGEYQLYRLFNFIRHPNLFVLPGSLRKTCSLDATQFSALPV